MICLNETKCRGQPLPDIDGYHVAAQSSRELNLGGGTAIIINNFIKYSVVMVASSDINAIDIYIGKDTMRVISAYWGPVTGSNCFDTTELNQLLLTHKHTLLLGDLNGHHGAWGSTDVNNRGTEIYNIITHHNLSILNEAGDNTFINSKRHTSNSLLDLALCTPSTVRYISSCHTLNHLGTQHVYHLPVVVNLNQNCKVSILQSDRVNTAKCDWLKFQSILSAQKYTTNITTITDSP
jgi:hypothetical protein